MAKNADDFLKAWKTSYIDAESVTLEDLDDVMDNITRDAKESGVSVEELNKAAGENLRAHIAKVLKGLDR